MLIATPLKGADGQVYAMAQGNLVIAGAGASAAGSKVQINHLSAGRIPDGATVERSVATPVAEGDSIQLDLNSSDYATAREVVRAINAKMGSGTADALDGRVVRVRMPPSADARVAFLAEIENLDVKQQTPSAKIVINARTGSIVMNQAVTLASCAVAHGNLSVTISTTPSVSQPGAVLEDRRDQGHREGRHHDHAAGRARSCRWRRAPSSPTSSRRSTCSARRRRTCSRSCRR